MLVEESAPVPVESVEAREQTGKKVVKRSPFVSSYDSKISSSRSKTQQQQPCKYFRAKQVCPFGPRCRYSHSASSHFSGEEVSDFRALTVEHPPTIDGVQNRRKSDTVCYHYLKSTCRYGSKCMYRHPLKNPESDKAPSKTSRHVRKEHVPSERNLGSFLISSVNVRPKTKKSLKPFSTDLREVELEQIETDFPDYVLLEKGKLRSVYRINYLPTDPDWEFNNIILEVTFPGPYPESPLIVRIPEHEVITSEGLEYVNHIFEQYTSSNVFDLRFRPFLCWLDKNIQSIFRDLIAERSFVQEAQHAHTDSECELSTDSPCSSEEDSTDSEEEVQSALTLPRKHGTEVRLHGLNISQSVATVSFANPKIVVGCARCKTQGDIRLKADSPVSVSCARCNVVYSVVYHPSLIHAASSTVGYLDVLGCNPVDLILLDCIMNIVCLECGFDNDTKTMMFGQWKECWCRRCHTKLSIVAEQSKFVQHQSVVVEGTKQDDIIPLKSKPIRRDLNLKVGTPLPNSGTCSHYSKSHRWLRFPCCGKMYPCDICHDSNESHVMERAVRMICGHCSKEQVYTTSKPCIGCGSDMTSAKHTTYWEGGKGCRSRAKMNRKDKHKYSNSSLKMSSQKNERVGKEGKNKRN